MVICNLCEAEYSETHIEIHLVGVHGVGGPKEMYTSSDFTPRVPENTFLDALVNPKTQTTSPNTKKNTKFCK